MSSLVIINVPNKNICLVLIISFTTCFEQLLAFIWFRNIKSYEICIFLNTHLIEIAENFL